MPEPTTPPSATEPCKKITLDVGPSDCFDAECDEYFTEAGEWAGRDTACSHISTEEVCETHSTLKGEGCEWERYDPAEPWPCQYDTTRTDVPAEAAL